MTTLCNINDLSEPGSKGFTIRGESIFAVKFDGQIFTYKNHCPHLGIELNFQPNVFLDTEGQMIQCANHGALFNINDGKCVSGPCLNKGLEAIPHTIENGNICVK